MMIPAGTASAETDPYQWAKDNRLLAHALGGFPSFYGGTMVYSDCLEAFTYNYAYGHRIFEVDLTPTSDGQLACVHDWSAGLMKSLWIPVPAGQENQPMSLADWKSKKIRNVYHTLGCQDLIDLLQGYRDAYFVLDTKDSTTTLQIMHTFNVITQTAKHVDPALLDRILPEIYTQEEYATVMAIWPFKAVLYCPDLVASETPASAFDFVKKKGIRALSIPDDRTWSNAWTAPSFLSLLKANNIYSYVYYAPADHATELGEVRSMMRDGVYGFYTDTILPSQLNWTATTKWTIDLPVE